jgi:hypothetical protein
VTLELDWRLTKKPPSGLAVSVRVEGTAQGTVKLDYAFLSDVLLIDVHTTGAPPRGRLDPGGVVQPALSAPSTPMSRSITGTPERTRAGSSSMAVGQSVAPPGSRDTRFCNC